MATERWTDEMVDALASSVRELRQELRESIGELRQELRESIGELRESVDSQRITVQALLQLAAQQQQATRRHEEEMELMKQRQAENDERFNTLLAEVRYLIRRLDKGEEES